MVPAKLFRIDFLLLRNEITCFQDFFHPPLIAGSSREHNSHQMILPVGMNKGVQGVVFIHTELLTRDENRTRGAKGNVAGTVSDRACPYSRSGIISRTGCNENRVGQAEFCRNFRKDLPHRLIAFKELRHLSLGNAADIQHFL